MKIALVVDGMQVGGIERVCLNYIKLLLKMKHKITVVNLSPSLNEIEKEVPNDVNLYHIRFSRKFCPEQYTQLVKRGFFYKIVYPIIYLLLLILNFLYKIFCKVKYRCCREDFDIVIAFSSHFNDLTFVAENFLKSHSKVSWCHGAIYEYLLISDGYINLYNKIRNIITLVNENNKEVLITNKQLKLNINKLYNPTLIQNTKINKKLVVELKKKYGNFLLMVSRFDYPYKDPFTVMRALQILNNKYGKQDLQLLFIGEGKDLDSAKMFAKNLGSKLENKIHFIGKRYDVQNFYKAAYLYVQAGAATEGLPTTMIEAMSFSLPEVITDVKVGPKEILGNNEYGLLCKPQDPQDMAGKINMLLDDENLYNNYKKKEKKRYKDFMPNRIEIKLNNILKEIVKDQL